MLAAYGAFYVALVGSSDGRPTALEELRQRANLVLRHKQGEGR